MKINKLLNRRGQATTEVVLLFPLFLILIIFMTKIFGLLVLVQKMEIASAYAAKRWQLESHTTAAFATGWDVRFLQRDIEKRVSEYIGFNNSAARNFLSLSRMEVNIERTQMWNEVRITVFTEPPKLAILCRYNKLVVCDDYRIRENCLKGYNYICESGGKLEVKKFVPNRDRPIPFILPLGTKGKGKPK